jgi:hypothetical protein
MGNYSSKEGHEERAVGRERGHVGQNDDDAIPMRGPNAGRGAQTSAQTRYQGNQPDVIQSQMRMGGPLQFQDDGNISQVGNAGGIINSFGQTESLVPTVFKWEHGGRQVYITGTFNNWERQIPMHRSGNDFTYVHNLKKGKHAFKFIVDEEWRFAPDQPTIADIEGRINNFIDVSDFTPYTGDDNFFERSKERKIPDSDYKTVVPDLDDYTKE